MPIDFTPPASGKKIDKNSNKPLDQNSIGTLIPGMTNNKIDIQYLPDGFGVDLPFLGVWNANTNEIIGGADNGLSLPRPSQAEGFYIVDVAGSTTLGSINSWALNDYAIYNSGAWSKYARNQSSDKTYTHDFTQETNLVINHNLGKYPSVKIIDGDSNIVNGEVKNVGLNSCQILFNNPQSGKVIFN